MEKSVLLVSNDREFCAKVEVLVRSRGFVCVTVNNIPDAYEALKRAYYDFVIIDYVVSASILVREFANGLSEQNQKVVIAVSDTADKLVRLILKLILFSGLMSKLV